MSTRRDNNGRSPKAATYRSYLLRLWCVDRCRASDWRASLEDSRTGEQIGFASMEDLFVFLLEQSKKTPSSDSNPQL